MRIITIDRTPCNHGEYTATISLNYDEAVLIRNALYVQLKTNKSKRGAILEDQWKIMTDILSYGMMDDFSILQLNAVKEDDQVTKTEVEE